MDAPRLLPVALLTALAFALLAPTVSAHSPALSADNKVRASIGQLNEPVSTYAVTGLDICFTTNPANSANRVPLAVANPGDFSATLMAPDGAKLHQDLKAQFGKTGCLTFADPYVLTLPGQYLVDLTGSFNGTTFAATGITAGGKVVDRGNITFPAASVPNDGDLNARIGVLEAQANALQTRIATLEAQDAARDGKSSPLPVAAWLIIGLAVLASAQRMRQA